MAVIGTFGTITIHRLKRAKAVPTITAAPDSTPAPEPTALTGQPIGLLLTLTYP